MSAADRRRILVTGGSMGIGREVGRALAQQDASVLIAARNRSAIDETLAQLPGSGHAGIELNVAEPSQWERAVTGPIAGRIDGLVCAAGVIEPIGTIDSYSAEQFLETVKVNLYGTYLAVRYCLPALKAAHGSVVTFSGGGATGPLPRFDAYAASKAAVVRLTENLAVSLRADGVNLNAVAPGFVVTRMQDVTLAAGEEAVGSEYFNKARRQVAEGGQPAREAADLVTFLLSEQARDITGKLISAQWDPWREPEFRQRLATDSDLATLRRVDGMFVETIER